MRRVWLAASVVVALVAAGSALSGASAPTPGTAKQVAALVKAAPSIRTLPSNATPTVGAAPDDFPTTYWPSLDNCITNGSAAAGTCVFGDVHGTKTMVAFGDSHALMWFGALDSIAKKAKWKLVALFDLGCPVADVTVWDVVTNSPDNGCPTWRTATIQRINALDPALVVMSESFYPDNAQDQPITNAAWQAGLEATFAALDSKGTKKVLIGEDVLIPTPLVCLSSNPHAIQKCSIVSTSSTWSEHWKLWEANHAADKAAAKAMHVAYVNQLAWECSTTCTVVIGRFVAYQSSGHLTNTYALYLSGVLKAALKPSM